MRLEELQQLAAAVQPAPASDAERHAAVFAFRELVARARDAIVHGRGVDPALAHALREAAAVLVAREGGAPGSGSSRAA